MISKAKFVWKSDNGQLELTINKVYDVIEYSRHNGDENDTIRILCDDNVIRTCYLCSGDDIYFTDAIAEYRDEVIDGILN